MFNLLIRKRFGYSRAALNQEKPFYIWCRVGLSLEKSPTSQEMMPFLSNSSFPGFRQLTPQIMMNNDSHYRQNKLKKSLKLGNAVQKSHTNERLAPKIHPNKPKKDLSIGFLSTSVWCGTLVINPCWLTNCEVCRGRCTNLTVVCWDLTCRPQTNVHLEHRYLFLFAINVSVIHGPRSLILRAE